MSSRIDLQHPLFRHLVWEGKTPPARRPGRVSPEPVADRFAATSPSIRTPIRTPTRRGLADDPLPPDQEALVRGVLSRAGLDLDAYRRRALARRIPACLRALRVATAAEAIALLKACDEYGPIALNVLMNGTTALFRDPGVFADLHRLIVPTLSRLDRPRVWSAGCSDGAELVSVAVLLYRAGLLDRCELLGTDCRPAAIERARRGAVSHAENLPPAERFPGDALDHATPLLSRTPEGLRAAPGILARIRWQVADVLATPAAASGTPGASEGWDLILCRNVAIYLTAEANNRLWNTLAAALNPGGFLVVGRAERAAAGAGLVRVAPSIYRRAGLSAAGRGAVGVGSATCYALGGAPCTTSHTVAVSGRLARPAEGSADNPGAATGMSPTRRSR